MMKNNTLKIIISVLIFALFIGTSMTAVSSSIRGSSEVTSISGTESTQSITSETANSETIVTENANEECSLCAQSVNTEQTELSATTVIISSQNNNNNESCESCHEAAEFAVDYTKENNPFPLFTGEGPFPVLQYVNDIIVWMVSIPIPA